MRHIEIHRLGRRDIRRQRRHGRQRNTVIRIGPDNRQRGNIDRTDLGQIDGRRRPRPFLLGKLPRESFHPAGMHTALPGRSPSDPRILGVNGRLRHLAAIGAPDGLETFVGGQLSRKTADLHPLDGQRHLERRGGKILPRGIHHIDPDRQRQVFGKSPAINLFGTVVAHPNTAGDLVMVTKEPRIGEIVSRACLTRGPGHRQPVVSHGLAGRAPGQTVGHQTMHLPRCRIGDHILARGLALVNDVAVRLADFFDDVGPLRP